MPEISIVNSLLVYKMKTRKKLHYIDFCFNLHVKFCKFIIPQNLQRLELMGNLILRQNQLRTYIYQKFNCTERYQQYQYCDKLNNVRVEQALEILLVTVTVRCLRYCGVRGVALYTFHSYNSFPAPTHREHRKHRKHHEYRKHREYRNTTNTARSTVVSLFDFATN